jgi:hypothetical protein
MVDRLSPIDRNLKAPQLARFEVALFACFGVSIDVFPGFSYSYSALAVLVLVLENTASSTSTISLSTSTIIAKTAQLQNWCLGGSYWGQ